MSFEPIGSAASRVVENVAARLETDAEQLAKQYGYDVERLRYQHDRRSFGSYCTTVDGSPKERERFRRALSIAIKRRQAQEIREGALLRARDAMDVGDVEKASAILARVNQTSMAE